MTRERTLNLRDSADWAIGCASAYEGSMRSMRIMTILRRLRRLAKRATIREPHHDTTKAKELCYMKY